MKANIDYMLGRSYEPIDENNLLKGEGSIFLHYLRIKCFE
jgi:hypothetical protein